MPSEYRFSITVTSVKLSGNSGKVTAKIKARGIDQSETVSVVRSTDTWQIVPVKKTTPSQLLFESLGVSVTTGGVFSQAQKTGTSTATLSNAKLVATGILIYLSDTANKFDLASATLQKVILPYVKNPKVFLSKATGKPFAFNNRLTGINVADVAEPAKTVLLYEGSQEKFTFTDGKVVIAFVDGHAKSFTPAQVKSGKLRWKP